MALFIWGLALFIWGLALFIWDFRFVVWLRAKTRMMDGLELLPKEKSYY
jgi:hypothetical protein